MGRLSLRVPRLRDMEYRQALLSQPDTMAYNRGRDLGGAEGYDPETGCIDFPRENWRWWRQVWLLNEPDFFSALLWDEAGERFVGEISWFYDGETQTHTAGILIEAESRGKGYCAEGLRLLVDRAFAREDIGVLRCDIPEGSAAALRGYRRAGFHEFGRADGQVTMLFTREDYERLFEGNGG